MLSFISFRRAAAIVLCDLGSSAFYAGNIAESYLGKSAPWFILGAGGASEFRRKLGGPCYTRFPTQSGNLTQKKRFRSCSAASATSVCY